MHEQTTVHPRVAAAGIACELPEGGLSASIAAVQDGIEPGGGKLNRLRGTVTNVAI